MAVSPDCLAAHISSETTLETTKITKILNSLISVATKQVKDTGTFRIPGLVNIKKTRVKPATEECRRRLFGSIVVIKAKPEQTVLKAACVKSLKRNVETRVFSKTGLADYISRHIKMHIQEVRKILRGLTSVATKQLKDTGKFKVPGLVTIKKTRVKPARKECRRRMFGTIMVVKAKPKQTILKASCVVSLKRSLEGYIQVLHSHDQGLASRKRYNH